MKKNFSFGNMIYICILGILLGFLVSLMWTKVVRAEDISRRELHQILRMNEEMSQPKINDLETEDEWFANFKRDLKKLDAELEQDLHRYYELREWSLQKRIEALEKRMKALEDMLSYKSGVTGIIIIPKLNYNAEYN